MHAEHTLRTAILTVIPDMFRTLRQSKLPEEHRFAVTVGAKTKQTLATWHLLEPSDVISVIALLNGSTDGGSEYTQKYRLKIA